MMMMTNWQFFVLDPESGQLQYYLNEVSRSQRPPRGSLPLLGAMVVSSNEFPYMFTIRSTNGNFYKLRGETVSYLPQSEYCFVTVFASSCGLL
uniref:PH domain-containing protein n=1 Tax=Amphilophus citrinellus TaxID=61819 RepID=A0A3Q0T1A5_AMPCI